MSLPDCPVAEAAVAPRVEPSGAPRTVRVPGAMAPLFARAEEAVARCFATFHADPSKGTIEVLGERYVLVRGAALSVEFFSLIEHLFGADQEAEAADYARHMLFDLGHAIGKADARSLHATMHLTDPIERLSAGPVHFAHTGWAFVDISAESHPSPDEDYYLLYDHPFSFEADAWLRSGRRAAFPVCILNAGYSSGWCEESFGFPLVASEVLCRAKGDDCCRFIMAPPRRIEERVEGYLKQQPGLAPRMRGYRIPQFFERKRAEGERQQAMVRQQKINALNEGLLAPGPLDEKLRKITDCVVEAFDADFCRSWVTQPGDRCDSGCVHAQVTDGPHVCRQRDRCLHLMASSGRYTHTDGEVHRRVPFGCYKIGRVASGAEHKFLTNDVGSEPRVHNHEWAKGLGLVAFAGYQLRPFGGDAMGVLALFSKRPITPDEDALLESLSSVAAQMIRAARAEEALVDSEVKFRTLFERTSDAVMLLDEQAFFDCNGATLTVFGCSSREEFLQRHPADLSPPTQPNGQDSLSAANERIASALATGTARFEWVHRRGDGADFPAEVLLNAIELGGRTVLQAVVRDISERKRAEDALRQTLSELERFNRLAVGREMRMIELKREVNQMAAKAGLRPPYDLSFATQEDESSRHVPS